MPQISELKVRLSQKVAENWPFAPEGNNIRISYVNPTSINPFAFKSETFKRFQEPYVNFITKLYFVYILYLTTL